MRVETTGEADAAWDALVAGDPEAAIHHERAWLDALDAAYPDWRPLYLLARDDAGRLLGGLPAVEARRAGLRQLFSLPYGTYAHALTAPGADGTAVRRALLDAWLRRARRPGTVRAHLEWGSRAAPLAQGDAPPAWLVTRRVHLLDLAPGFDAVWNAFRPSLRNTCRQAERLGVVARRETGPDARRAFLDLYAAQAASWPDHTPMRPAFLHGVLDRFPGRAALWIARRDGAPLAAKIALDSGAVTASWLTVHGPEARRAQAGPYLYRAVIEDACARGMTTFSFGASLGIAALEQFKESFGAGALDYLAVHRESAAFRALRALRDRRRGRSRT